MPLYEYACPTCKAQFEKIRSIAEGSSVPCPDCGTESSRLVSLVAAGVHSSSGPTMLPMAGGGAGACCGGSCDC